MSKENNKASAFQKAREGLWTSLQKHLEKLYETEKQFKQSVGFTDTFPFNSQILDSEKLSEYWQNRNNLKDLFIDETEQLSTLIKAIRQKDYKEDDKKQLFLMILRYVDIAESIFKQLETYKPLKFKEEEEYINALNTFNRLHNFIRLYIKGIKI